MSASYLEQTVGGLNNNEKIIEITKQIYNNIDCPILDIGEKKGNTGYIDFIQPNDFSESIVKGTDIYGRKFISFRAIVEYTNDTQCQTFTTIFQRSILKEREHIWCGAGPGPCLFYTTGGMTLDQLMLLDKLLTEKSVDITNETHNLCRIISSTPWATEDEYPSKKIYLVDQESCL